MVTIVLAGMLALVQPARPATDACTLLTDDDVKSTLAVVVRERRPASDASPGLLLAQCYLATDGPRSVSIAVAGGATSRSNTTTAREYWRRQFHARREREEEERGEKNAESKPRRINGLGDEAYWTSSRVAGALYVLRGDRFIRVSVGGIQDERERLEKSRALAAAALKHLS